MEEIDIIKNVNAELKQKIVELEERLKKYTDNTKKYYENHKEEIKQKVKEYKEKTNRYNLIGYGEKFIFQFRELPYDLKEIISNKCVEGIEGNFINIPDFKNFHVNVKSRELPTIHPQMGITIESIQRLNDGVRLFINCSSSSSKTPGKITGEVMPENQVHKYFELKGIKNWRCILDNSYDGTEIKQLLKSNQNNSLEFVSIFCLLTSTKYDC